MISFFIICLTLPITKFPFVLKAIKINISDGIGKLYQNLKKQEDSLFLFCFLNHFQCRCNATFNQFFDNQILNLHFLLNKRILKILI